MMHPSKKKSNLVYSYTIAQCCLATEFHPELLGQTLVLGSFVGNFLSLTLCPLF